MVTKVRVLEYMQEKAVFEPEEKTQSPIIKTAELPKHPIPGALGSISLITYAITAKYTDGLPLYRIENNLSATVAVSQSLRLPAALCSNARGHRSTLALEYRKSVKPASFFFFNKRAKLSACDHPRFQ